MAGIAVLGPVVAAMATVYAVFAVLAPLLWEATSGLETGRRRALYTVATLAAAQVVFAAFALGTARLVRQSVRDALGLRRPRVSGRVVAASALGTFVPAWVGFVLAGRLFPEPTRGYRHMFVVIGEAPPAWAAGLVASFMLLPAVAEELLFRGWLQTGLQRALNAPLAIVITVPLFAVIHQDPQHVTAVALTAVWFCWVRYAAASTFAGMICHAVNNAVIGTMIAFGLITPTAVHPALTAFVVLAALPAFAYAASRLCRGPGRPFAATRTRSEAAGR